MSEVRTRVLIVDDERAIRRFLRVSLSAHDYSVHEAVNGEEALLAVAALHPDLIILDLGLPDMDGIEVSRQIRKFTKTPIIILSVRESEDDKVTALDEGADDYLCKPFGMDELLARVRVAMRHSRHANLETVFSVGDLRVDLEHHHVTVAGREISLTPKEYQLLQLLVQNAGKVLTHHYLLNEIWGKAYQSENHLLRVNMSNLRQKIEPDPTRPRYILTELGVGYRLYVE